MRLCTTPTEWQVVYGGCIPTVRLVVDLRHCVHPEHKEFYASNRINTYRANPRIPSKELSG
jgi:hypothetical protein